MKRGREDEENSKLRAKVDEKKGGKNDEKEEKAKGGGKVGEGREYPSLLH